MKITLLITFMCFINCKVDIKKSILKNFEEKPTKEYFKVYHFLYNKEYNLNSEEGVLRYKIFKSNLNIIKEHNKKLSSFKMGVNKFTDLSPEEFRKKYLMNPELKRKQKEGLRFLSEEGYFDEYSDSDDEKLFEKSQNISKEFNFEEKIPVDWSSSFSDVRNQGGCGSCWAFAVTGVVESFRNRKNKLNMGYLSTQQLIDCDNNNGACSGGNYNYAFTYIKNTGVVDDPAYPYKEKETKCSIPANFKRQKIKSYQYCSNKSYYSTRRCTERKVFANLALGATATAIDGNILNYYESGVFDANCSEDNHAVILVGYGISELGTEYFKIRNSWGSDWGESGYIRIARNESNNKSCFITNESFTVTLP